MTRRKKIFIWCIGLFFGLIGSLVLLAPTLIDSSTLKRKIQAVVSKNNIGQINYSNVYLSLFPLPHLNLQDFSLSVPGRVECSVAILKIYPELFPLLNGQIRLSKLHLDMPEFKVNLPAEPVKNDTKEKELTLLNITDSLAAAISPLAPYVSTLYIEINQGQIDLSVGGEKKTSIQDLSLDADFDFKGPRSFKIELEVASPDLKINSGRKQVKINCDRLKTSLRVDDDKTSVSLDDLDLVQPGVKMSGLLVADPKSSNLSLNLDAQGLDTVSVRTTALNLFGNNETTRDIFDYIKGGRIPQISVQFKGQRPADLEDLKNFIIKGWMRDGAISIADIGMHLSGVNGEVKIADGLLEAGKLSARLGESFGRDGLLKVGLAEDNDTFHLDFILKAKLDQLPGVLKKIIDNEAFVTELDWITNLKGTGEARVLLGETFEDIKTTIDVSQFKLSADYQRIPFPIEIHKGQFVFSENVIKINDLTGAVGNSVFSGVILNMQWQKNLSIDIPSGSIVLDADELYPWIASFETIQKELSDVKDVKGSLELSALNLKSPNDISKTWQMSATGEVKELIVNTTLLPGELHLVAGEFHLNPNHFSFKDLNTRLLDADLNLTATFSGPFNHPEQADLKVSGELGEKAIHLLIHDHLNFPDAYVVHAPVNLNETQIAWKQPSDFSVKGNIVFPKGAEVYTDFYYQPGNLAIKSLDILDQKSKAAIAFGLNKNVFNLTFNGQLHKQTLGRIFVSEKWSNGWLKGDFKTVFVKGNLTQSTFKGKLKGGNLIVPLTDSESMVFGRFDFAAQKNRIIVNDLSLALQENHADLKGKVDMTADGFLLDLDASSDNLMLNFSGITAKKSESEQKGKPQKSLWQYPVTGAIHLTAKSFSFKNYTWKPFHADILPITDGVKIKVNKAQLCGIDSVGTIRFSGNELDLDFQLTAKDKDVAPSYACLTNNRVQMTGVFDFAGQIKANGKPDDLLRSVQGHFYFIASKGQITKDKKLSRILEVLNFTEIVKGKLPDLRSEGFNYKTVNIEGEFANEILNLKKIYMDGKTLDLIGQGTIDLDQEILDIELLAAPFKTVDSAIKHIPGVNYLMVGNLVSIPVSVKGDVADPKVDVMSTSAVRSSLKDFAERAIKSPIILFESMMPGKKHE